MCSFHTATLVNLLGCGKVVRKLTVSGCLSVLSPRSFSTAACYRLRRWVEVVCRQNLLRCVRWRNIRDIELDGKILFVLGWLFAFVELAFFLHYHILNRDWNVAVLNNLRGPSSIREDWGDLLTMLVRRLELRLYAQLLHLGLDATAWS